MTAVDAKTMLAHSAAIRNVGTVPPSKLDRRVSPHNVRLPVQLAIRYSIRSFY